jgi:hypothetical protein
MGGASKATLGKKRAFLGLLPQIGAFMLDIGEYDTASTFRSYL